MREAQEDFLEQETQKVKQDDLTELFMIKAQKRRKLIITQEVEEVSEAEKVLLAKEELLKLFVQKADEEDSKK